MLRPTVLLYAAVATLWVVVAEAKSIEWLSLDVDARIDAEGALHYQWSSAEHLLRWRIRQPSEAVFERVELGYRIDYVLSGALRLEPDGSYSLSHDFAFERPSEIQRLRVKLVLDEVWSTRSPTPIELRREHVQSGDSAVLELSLRYTGAELPALLRPARTSATSTPWPHGRLVTAAIFLLLVAALVEVLFAKSRRIGHFEPLPRQEDIDRSWIEAHIWR